MSHYDWFAPRPGLCRQRRLNKTPRYPARALPLQARTRLQQIAFSSAVDSHVAANAGKLNSYHVSRNGRGRSGPVRWLKCNLRRSLQGKNLRTVRIDCAVIDPRLAGRTELDGLHENVLRGGRSVAYRILECGRRT